MNPEYCPFCGVKGNIVDAVASFKIPRRFRPVDVTMHAKRCCACGLGFYPLDFGGFADAH